MCLFHDKLHQPAGLRLTSLNSAYLFTLLCDIFFPQKSEFLTYFLIYSAPNCIKHCFVRFRSLCWGKGRCFVTFRELWTADSGGYTMKCRRVKPKPWEVRRRCSVLGPGQEKGSSSGPGEVVADASLWSRPSFGLAWRKKGQKAETLCVKICLPCHNETFDNTFISGRYIKATTSQLA